MLFLPTLYALKSLSLCKIKKLWYEKICHFTFSVLALSGNAGAKYGT